MKRVVARNGVGKEGNAPLILDNNHGDVATVQQHLLDHSGASSVAVGGFGDVLQHHVDKVVEAGEGAFKLLIQGHEDPHLFADGLVDRLEGKYGIH